MKKLLLSIPFLLVILLFLGCESRVTQFNVNKKVDLPFTLFSETGSYSEIVEYDGIKRSQLDISENAKIHKISLKNAYIDVKGLPGHVSKKYKIFLSMKQSLNGSEVPFMHYDVEQFLEPVSISALALGYLNTAGIKEINKFMNDNLILDLGTKAYIRIYADPVDGKKERLNLQFEVQLEFNIEYEDCFYTGNFGKAECKQ